jgi:hypothetical protein
MLIVALARTIVARVAIHATGMAQHRGDGRKRVGGRFGGLGLCDPGLR